MSRYGLIVAVVLIAAGTFAAVRWSRNDSAADRVQHTVHWPADCVKVSQNELTAGRDRARGTAARHVTAIVCEDAGPGVLLAQFDSRQARTSALATYRPSEPICLYKTDVVVD